jgi:murein DD-endopeptidase MepM/ murein hydrolase activator NlpD
VNRSLQLRTCPDRRPRQGLARPHVVLAATVALALAASGAGRTAWADTSSDRNATSRKRKEVQAQLDLAKASDDAVEAELNRLNAAVAVQQARTDEASQAEAAAMAGVRQASDRLQALDARVRGLRQDLARRAVQAYTDPAGQGGLAALSRASSLDEAAQRQALLAVVQSDTAGAVEGLRGTRQDQADATKTLEAAQHLATQRATVEVARTKKLRASQAVQAATHAELTKRIADLQSESRELASHEQDLENLIRARSAPAAGVAPGTVVGSGSPSSAGLIWPLHGPVSSEFGPRWGGFHPGIDIALPTGTPIAAAKAGTVVFSGPNDGYGNFVVIDHGGGLATAYAHQSRIVVGEGDHVNQGQVIGFVGSTGFSTGPHLHFEVRVNGSPQNPRNYEPRGP